MTAKNFFSLKKSMMLLTLAGAALVLNVFFLNCSGGLSAGGGGGGGGTGQAGGAGEELDNVGLLKGTWAQEHCAVTGGKGYREFFMMSQTNSTTLHFNKDIYETLATDCSGAGAGIGVDDLGNIVFSATLRDGGAKYFRGIWTTPQGTVTTVYWGLRDANTLCVVADTVPSSFTTVQDLTNYINISYQNKFCYIKQ